MQRTSEQDVYIFFTLGLNLVAMISFTVLLYFMLSAKSTPSKLLAQVFIQMGSTVANTIFVFAYADFYYRVRYALANEEERAQNLSLL